MARRIDDESKHTAPMTLPSRVTLFLLQELGINHGDPIILTPHEQASLELTRFKIQRETEIIHFVDATLQDYPELTIDQLKAVLNDQGFIDESLIAVASTHFQRIQYAKNKDTLRFDEPNTQSLLKKLRIK